MCYLSTALTPVGNIEQLDGDLRENRGKKRKVKGVGHISPVAGEERLGLWSSVPQNGWQWGCLEPNNLNKCSKSIKYINIAGVYTSKTLLF